MERRVREYVRIDSHRSLDEVVGVLAHLRDTLPAGAEAEIQIRGDEFFGTHLCVTYLRGLSEEEASCEARYACADLHPIAAAA